jgi:hypothetical protein
MYRNADLVITQTPPNALKGLRIVRKCISYLLGCHIDQSQMWGKLDDFPVLCGHYRVDPVNVTQQLPGGLV